MPEQETGRPPGCMVIDVGRRQGGVALVVALDNPQNVNVIAGQAHFIKTVEDLHEALGAAGSVSLFARRAPA